MSGGGQDDYQYSGSRDVFAKAEKWLAPAPIPDVSPWNNREAEITGFSDYLTQLCSWAAQASIDFSREIGQAARWPDVLKWESLTREQQNRSTRLLAMLRAAFTSHPRTSMLTNAFIEGVSLDGNLGIHFP